MTVISSCEPHKQNWIIQHTDQTDILFHFFAYDRTHSQKSKCGQFYYKPVVVPNPVVPVPKAEVEPGVWNTLVPVLLFAALPNKPVPVDPKPPNDAV